jgi:hypothetical protein
MRSGLIDNSSSKEVLRVSSLEKGSSQGKDIEPKFSEHSPSSCLK